MNKPYPKLKLLSGQIFVSTVLPISLLILLGILIFSHTAYAASFTPLEAYSGDTIKIKYDTDDCLSYGNGSVIIGKMSASVRYWYSCLGIIYATVPAGLKYTANVVVVTKSGIVENIGTLVIPYPIIDSLSPALIEPGVTKVTIKGKGFRDKSYEGNNIFFGDVPFKKNRDIIKWTDTEIIGIAPKEITYAWKLAIKIEPYDLMHGGPDYGLVTGPSRDTYSYKQRHYLNKMQVPEAWGIIKDSRKIIVAVIDDGIDMSHSDLRGNVWVNVDEYVNGDDTDGNGYVDDVYGHAFSYFTYGPIKNVYKYLPGHIKKYTGYTNHGTQVAGIIGAVGDNNHGIAGVTWKVKIMDLPIFELYYWDQGIIPIELVNERIAEAVLYAVDNGADVINMSFSTGDKPSSDVQDAIYYAHSKGVILVVAAGNDDLNLNDTPIYPVCYDGVIGVAATDLNDKKAKFSNYGSDCVDISAPGEDIAVLEYDVVDNGSRTVIASHGTSFSAPFVSGTVALVKAKNPNWSNYQIEHALLNSTDNIDYLNPRYYGQLGAGRLNVYKAVSTNNPPKELSKMPDGTLLSSFGSPNVYLIEGGYRRWIADYDIFVAYGFDLSKIIDIPTTELEKYPLGEPLDLPRGGESLYESIFEGSLIRAEGTIDIWIVKYVGNKRFKRLILSPSVFNNYGHLRWEDVMDVSQSVVDAFATSELVRAVGDERVYKLYPQGDTGQKRWIKAPEVFERNGWDTDAIYEINAFDRDSYVTGSLLE